MYINILFLVVAIAQNQRIQILEGSVSSGETKSSFHIQGSNYCVFQRKVEPLIIRHLTMIK